MTTLCTNLDLQRLGRINRKLITVTIEVSQNSTTGSVQEVFSGEIRRIVYDVPDLEGTAPTLGFNLKDEDGIVHYSKSGIAENTKTVDLPLDANGNFIAISGVLSWEVVASEPQTSDRVVNIIVYYV